MTVSTTSEPGRAARLDESRKGRRLGEASLKKKALGLAAFLIIAATALNALFGERGALGLMKAREEHDALLLEVEALEAENERLVREIRELRSDPLVVERLAREVLGMAREGEIVVTVRYPDGR
jgi:cell division protein FtsB